MSSSAGDFLTPERREHLIASTAARDITAQVLNVNGGERGTR